MKSKSVATIAVVSLAISGCAKDYAAAPIAGSGQQIRYTQGIATTFSDKEKGSVQITPLGYIKDDNRLIFGAAAFNKGTESQNFSLERVSVTSNAISLRTYTRDELAHEARVKAAWATAAVILAGGLAAYSASQAAYSSTNGYISGPGGTATFYATRYDPAVAAAGTAAAGAATGYGLATINNSLDNTIANLNGSILQINTVNPGTSAGGAIVVDMPKAKTFPQPVELSIDWNGERHVFDYTVGPVQR
jgi:hypothetical protein